MSTRMSSGPIVTRDRGEVRTIISLTFGFGYASSGPSAELFPSLNRSPTAAPLRRRYFRYEEEFNVVFASSYQLQGELNDERYRYRKVGFSTLTSGLAVYNRPIL
jgi:hypothetical protein